MNMLSALEIFKNENALYELTIYFLTLFYFYDIRKFQRWIHAIRTEQFN